MSGSTSTRKLPGILPLEQARSIVEEHATLLHGCGEEKVSLLDSVGRVLAEEIRADRDFPPFARSTRDGYAVRSEDTARLPARLKIKCEIRAGQSVDIEIPELLGGEAAEIMTGAPLPPGADSVVMVEHTSRIGDFVMVEREVESRENVVPQGSEAHAGDVLLRPGHRMDYSAVALAASVGKSELHVHVRPRVAILATGDEIVPIDANPAANQIRNSNTYSLAAQVREAGGEPVLLAVAPDEPERLRELLDEGLATDLLLITGGVSMGKYDLVEDALKQFGAEFFFTGAQIQPGKPVVFGRVKRSAYSGNEHTYFFGLPGNPISTMVTFEIFARALINALSGAQAGKLRFVQARLKSDIRVKTGLTRFLPAVFAGEYHSAWVEAVRWQGSGDIAAMGRANCYVVVPRDRGHLFAEDIVNVMLR